MVRHRRLRSRRLSTIHYLLRSAHAVAAAVQAAPEKKVIVEGGTQIPSLFSSKPFHSTKAKVKGACEAHEAQEAHV